MKHLIILPPSILHCPSWHLYPDGHVSWSKIWEQTRQLLTILHVCLGLFLFCQQFVHVFKMQQCITVIANFFQLLKNECVWFRSCSWMATYFKDEWCAAILVFVLMVGNYIVTLLYWFIHYIVYQFHSSRNITKCYKHLFKVGHKIKCNIWMCVNFKRYLLRVLLSQTVGYLFNAWSIDWLDRVLRRIGNISAM